MRTAVLAGIAALLVIVAGARAPESTRAAPPPPAALVFQADMTGSDVVPPVETTAWGFVRFFFNEDRSHASYTVDVKTLSNSLVAGADIHRGAPGTNGPVIKHLTDGNFIVTGGEIDFTPAELQEMASGNWYVSLKTHAHPEGELRGQITVPANFLPKSIATPTRTPTVAPVRSATPAPGATPRPGGVGITPPDTGDAGLAGPRDAGVSGVALGVVTLAGLAVAGQARRWALASRP
jgi:hypothetical protein